MAEQDGAALGAGDTRNGKTMNLYERIRDNRPIAIWAGKLLTLQKLASLQPQYLASRAKVHAEMADSWNLTRGYVNGEVHTKAILNDVLDRLVKKRMRRSA